MDIGSIMAALAAGKHSLDLVKAAAEVKDFNSVLVLTTEANQKSGCSAAAFPPQRANLLQLQEEHFKTREELRGMQSAKSKHDAYRLAEVGALGAFVYESNDSTLKHYACQPCLDKDGTISVLQPNGSFLRCTVCKQAYRLRRDDAIDYPR